MSGTDTNVGKTIVSAILVNKIKGIYHKPIQCGLDEKGRKDSDIIENLCVNKTILKETYFFNEPISPNIAAKNEKKKILMSKLLNKICNNFEKQIIIEGAGGLSVPINKKYLMVDLIKLSKLPLILVSRTSLGTINHTLLSINLIKQKKINFHGLVFVGEDIPETIESILDYGEKIYGMKIQLLAKIPSLKKLNKSKIEEMQKLFL
ncbi:MAG: dethiobiotin synthase [Alphaproteobacteria bacterium]